MKKNLLVDFASKVDPQSLSPRQRQILELRLSGLTFTAIANRLGISSERVRQLEARIASRARRAELRAAEK